MEDGDIMKQMAGIYFILAITFLIMLSGCTDTGNASRNQDTGTQNPNATDSGTRYISLDEISPHDSADDCWFAIHGKVYDVTPFIQGGLHPGGDVILEGCGTDATVLFETRPMGSGTPHSERARNLLENYYIGELR